MSRSLRCLAILAVALACPLPVAAQTYAEVLAECVTLFTPMVSVEQAQKFVPDNPLGEEPDVSGNSESCWVEFKDKDWSPTKPGSATPLLHFALTHGAGQARKYEDQLKTVRQVAKKTYAPVDAAKFPGVEKAYSYTGFGRHWLVMLIGENILTVQVFDTYPSTTLDDFATLVLQATTAPGLRAWRERP